LLVEELIFRLVQFTKLAPSHPGLLLNRMHLLLIGSHPTDVLSAPLDRMYDTYTSNVTSSAQIMPYDPRPPPAWGRILTLAMYEGAIGNVMVCLREEGPEFAKQVVEAEGVWYRREEMRRGEAAYHIR
jgi:hypothetical protein